MTRRLFPLALLAGLAVLFIATSLINNRDESVTLQGELQTDTRLGIPGQAPPTRYFLEADSDSVYLDFSATTALEAEAELRVGDTVVVIGKATTRQTVTVQGDTIEWTVIEVRRLEEPALSRN